MTETEIQEFFASAFSDLAPGIIERMTASEARMMRDIGPSVDELVESARAAAVASVTCWMQLRLMARLAAKGAD